MRTDPHEPGVGHRDAAQHVRLVDAQLQHLGCLGELDSGVHPHRLEGLLGGGGAHEQSLAVEHLDHIGEVVLALGVLGGKAVEMGEQHRGVEAVRAGVDLGEVVLVGTQVLLLDDRGDSAIAIAHDAAVVAGVGQVRGEQRERGTAALAHRYEAGDGVGPQQGRVAREHHERAGEPVERVPRRHDRVAGAQLLLLPHGLDAVGQERLDQLGVVAGDHDDPLAARLARRVDHELHHGLAQDLVRDLGLRGLHPGPLACGEDQRGSGHG